MSNTPALYFGVTLDASDPLPRTLTLWFTDEHKAKKYIKKNLAIVLLYETATHAQVLEELHADNNVLAE